MRRTRKRNYFTNVVSFLLENLAHAQVGVPLDALGNGYQDAIRPQVRRRLSACFPNGKGGAGANYHVRSLQARKLPGDPQAVRQVNAFEQRIFPVFFHLRRLGGIVGPEIGLMAVVAENLAQGSTPAAAA